MVEDFYIASTLPRHGHVLQKLENGMWHELECTEIASLVRGEFLLGHVSNISEHLAQMLRG